jgi:hypothetical protein
MTKQNKKNKKTVKKEAFREGIFGGIGRAIKRAVNSAAKAIKKEIMKPVNAFLEVIMKPINTIEDFIVTILCLASYLQLVFEWFSRTLKTITKYFLAILPCFVIWGVNSFILFLQYIIFDVILSILLIPAQKIGIALDYPYISSIKLDKSTKDKLYEKTNLLKSVLKWLDNSSLDLKFKPYKGCFQIGDIKPFPQWPL